MIATVAFEVALIPVKGSKSEVVFDCGKVSLSVLAQTFLWVYGPCMDLYHLLLGYGWFTVY